MKLQNSGALRLAKLVVAVVPPSVWILSETASMALGCAAMAEAKGDRVVPVGAMATILEVAGVLGRENIAAALVKEDGAAMAGIISERGIVGSLEEHGPGVLELRAADLMMRSIVTRRPGSDTEEIMAQILASRVRHLPVMLDGSLVGIISDADVVKAVVSEYKRMTKVLQDEVVTAAGWSPDED